ncbi:MAG: hypothetical protein ACYDBX_04365 [Patescibacteria group bacterium]
MDKTERTTIRINAVLIKQARDIAYNQKVSLQKVINMLILRGMQDINDNSERLIIGTRIDKIRENLKIKDFSDIVVESKKDLK